MQAVVFRELTALSTAILQGKVARLRSVYALRGPVESHAAMHQSHPFFFFLRDAREFFDNYVLFRDGIAAFIRRGGIETPPGAPLEQLLDLAYAAYLGREVNTGVINHAVQLLLGDALPPIQPEARARLAGAGGRRRRSSLARRQSALYLAPASPRRGTA